MMTIWPYTHMPKTSAYDLLFSVKLFYHLIQPYYYA